MTCTDSRTVFRMHRWAVIESVVYTIPGEKIEVNAMVTKERFLLFQMMICRERAARLDMVMAPQI